MYLILYLFSTKATYPYFIIPNPDHVFKSKMTSAYSIRFWFTELPKTDIMILL